MVRLGVFGTGPWAKLVHIPAALTHPDIELVGVWGRRAQAVEAVAREVGLQAYTDLEELLDRVDAAAVVLPPSAQPDIAIRAALAGKSLILEKPIADTLAGADALVEAVHRGSVASLVCFTRRWIPEYAAWLDDLRTSSDRRGGDVTMLSASMTKPSPFSASTWRAADGGLWDMGPHAVSVLEAVLGTVVAVQAAEGPWHEVRVLAVHEHGATSTFTVGIACPPGVDIEELGFYGDRGRDRAPFDQAVTIERCLQAQANVLTSLVDQRRTKRRRHVLDVRYGRHVVHVLSCVQEALTRGTSVEVAAHG